MGNSKQYKKKYYEDNKEELSKKAKITYNKNREARLLKSKEYRENYKEILKERNKAYYNRNKEKITNKNKEWAINNPDKVKKAKKKWANTNKDNINKRVKTNEFRVERNSKTKLRLENDKLFYLSVSIRKKILKAFSIKGQKKNYPTEQILGCSFQEFKQYLESKFESWMNWSNHGKYNGTLNHGWDIDHIIPISTAKTEEDVIRLNHYTNLQPLCSYTNRKIKRDKLI